MKVTYHIETISSAWEFASRKKNPSETYKSEDKPTSIKNLEHTSLVWQELIEAFTAEKKPNYNTGLAFICAILHDLIENDPSNFAEIADGFGNDVAEGVKALTNNKRLPSQQAQAADRLMRTRNQSKEVWAVSMAICITQLTPPPPEWSKEQIVQQFQTARITHDTLYEAHGYLAQRLSAKIDEYQQYLSMATVPVF